MYVLAYIKMKSERAKEHLDAFDKEVAAYLKEAQIVTTTEDHERALCIRRTQWRAMPPLLGMLLGEFLYCLRSGLDQLAFQVALPTARKNSPNEICFPVAARVANSKERRNLQKILELFPTDVAAQIDALQPYKSPGRAEDHPLWQLNKLCNIDKHWIIPFNSRHKPIFVPRNPAVTINHFEAEDAIEVSVPLQDKWQFDFDPNLPGNLELGEWSTDLAIPLVD